MAQRSPTRLIGHNMSQPARPRDEPEADINIGSFADGTPRVVFGYREDSGIMYIEYADNEIAIISDHRIIVEMGWAACTHYYPSQEYLGGPVEIKCSHGGYERTSQDAFDAAVAIQKELENSGEFVPIYVRW